MKFTKPLLIAGVAGTVALGSIAGLQVASAATNGSERHEGMIEKLSTKFNLNKDEVKAVFEEERAEHQAEHQKNLEERLTQAVTDKKITEEQKSKILAKHAELKTKMEALKEKSQEERHEAMESYHDEMEQWAKDNNISEEFLRFGMKVGGPGHGGHKFMMRGQ